MDQQAWYEEEESNEPIAVEELEKICKETAEKVAAVKKIEAEVKDQKSVIEKMKRKIMFHLEKLGKTKYVSEAGTFYTITEFSVTTPKTEDEKKAFFDFCTENDIFYKYATVNSRSLQTLYRSLLESEGPDFKLPGVGEAKVYEKLGMRAK